MTFHNRPRSLSRLSWDAYPVRACRSRRHCEVCRKGIAVGQLYRDGGYSRRAHDACVPGLAAPPSQEREPG